MTKARLSLAIGMAVSVGATSAVAESEAGAIELGKGVLFTPVLDVNLLHDDNVIHTDENQTDSWMTELKPSFLLSAENGTSEYNLRYTLARGDYQDSDADNYTDHALEADASWEMNDRNRFSLAASYLDLHEARGTGYSQGFGLLLAEPDRFSETDVNGTYRFGAESARGNLELELGTSARDYDPTQFVDGFAADALVSGRDYGANYGAARFFYNTGGKTKLLAEVNHRQIGYDEVRVDDTSRDSAENKILFGMTWEGTAKTTGTVKLGARSKKFDEPTREDFAAPAWEIGVMWEPKSYSTFEFTAASRFEEARGAGNFADVEVLAASWSHDWAERLSTDVTLYNQNMDYEGIDRTEDVSGASVKANYEMRRWLTFTLGYATGSQDSTEVGYDYDRAVTTFGFRATL
ncbi:outer membrane beta-barrel protein [Microbulbifer guangxiensis]|uniref:outer membrane beta-barrel protein n=1 Tax=Microbulbifer guangxiensis TaxID=2904249 RepID=UPI001F44A8F3|nr:outer membrane beta-barrel protein [Microbulbifer guangxiensis]